MLQLTQDTTVKCPILYFDNDDEFYQFCVNPNLIISEYTKDDGNIGYSVDWDFTDLYKDAISKNTKFIIKDPNSQVCKHGKITYRVNTKPINNVELYDEFV